MYSWISPQGRINIAEGFFNEKIYIKLPSTESKPWSVKVSMAYFDQQ